ncbi:MAG: type IX secretion system membrane protein PorP/SprF [Aureispira sp.]|nr:type IX secretion system membrane protein PorP/SprF [Aureispira sp.]
MRLGQYTLSILLSALFFSNVYSQQLPLLSEYQHSATMLNPAMTGWEDITSIAATYRHQWTGMTQAPRTAMLNFNYFADRQNMGFGGMFMHDQTGPTSFTGLQLNYAYHLRFKSEKEGLYKRHRLLLGISLSGLMYRLKGADLLYNDVDDPLIVNGNDTKFLPDAGAGIFYYNDLYYVGISVPQMISLNVKFHDDTALSNMRRVAHMYFNTGVRIKLNGKQQQEDSKAKKHFLVPSVWLKYAPSSPLHFTANLRYVWDNVFQIGLGASTDASIIADFNVTVKKQFRIGYAFSVGANSLTRHTGTNHEVMLTYVFNSGGRGWFFDKTTLRTKSKPVD